MKLKFNLVICSLLLSQLGWTQSEEYVNISSTIVDQNGDPVSFAHIGVKGKNLGGITNQDGFFSYNIPVDYIDDTLVISSMGLASLEIAVKDVAGDQGLKQTMFEQAIELEGITIYAPAKLLGEAFANFEKDRSKSPYFKCAGLYTLTSEENEEYTLFEQLTFDAYYRGELDESGIDILSHRRSIDYSMFPVLYSQRAQSHIFPVSREILGLPVYKQIANKTNRIDDLELKITDIVEIENQKVYVVTEYQRTTNNFVSKYFNYYISEEKNELIKYSEIIGDFSLRPHERMTNAGKYNTDLIELSQSYYLRTENDLTRVTKAERIYKWVNVDRMTGNLLKLHKQTVTVELTGFETLSDQPEKYPSRLKLPNAESYDEAYWNAWNDTSKYDIGEDIVNDLSETIPLAAQFNQTNGLIVLANSVREENFTKKDQRKQSEIEDVDQFIHDLKDNNYVSGFAPELTWDDIPALMEIANSTKVLTNFPRNILGRYYINQCQLGVIAMWLIDSIRKNHGKKPRKAWYISPFPIFESRSETEQITDLRRKGNNANVLVKNTDAKLLNAYNSFEEWWSMAQQMNKNKAKRINPLSSSDLKWMGL